MGRGGSRFRKPEAAGVNMVGGSPPEGRLALGVQWGVGGQVLLLTGPAPVTHGDPPFFLLSTQPWLIWHIVLVNSGEVPCSQPRLAAQWMRLEVSLATWGGACFH